MTSLQQAAHVLDERSAARQPDLASAARPGHDVHSEVADELRPMVEALLDGAQARVEFWDGSAIGPPSGVVPTLEVRSPDALRRIVRAPGDLGVARAFVAGDLDVDGDLFDLVAELRPAGKRLHRVLPVMPALVRAGTRLGLFASPPPPPSIEVKPRGWVHSKRRDAHVVSHHYDVGNAFYRLVLGESMTYSCARFVEPDDTLETAQAAKHELVCRKVGLADRTGMRLLDVGCGWGSMAMHAARHHSAQVVGITLSREQAQEATRRVRAAGLDGLIEIRLQDYRDLGAEQFDAISSVGMFEHVGSRNAAVYFAALHRALAPGGRLLNHAISSVGGSKLVQRGFMYRYVFPDGELIDVGNVVLAMEAAGFEVRDVESLREHYSRTLRHWVANLRAHWSAAVELVGEERARVWLLYMTASAIGFDDAGLSIHQVLGVVPRPGGDSAMPSTRRDWE